MRFRLTLVSILFIMTGLSLPAFAAPPKKTILVFGDSLSAAYGLPREQGWVTLLQQRLDQENYAYQINNASISGETTSGGLSRFAQALQTTKPDIVLLELGANDGLRGLPVADMQKNLSHMIDAAHAAHAKPVLIGMMIPPNYGPRYTQSFNAAFRELAAQYKLPLVPFLLEGVAGKADLNQDDGLHPLAQAQPMLLDNVWKTLQPILIKPKAAR